MNRRPRRSGYDDRVNLDDSLTPDAADDHSLTPDAPDDHSLTPDAPDDHSLTPDAPDDHNVTLDAADDDWEWRRKIRSNPHSHLIYRLVVGVLGLIILVVGLIMVPFPGPGWLVVFLGLAIWATEFEWAQRLLHHARDILKTWNERLKPQPWWVKGLVLLVTMVAVAAIFWLLFLISGVPPFFPDGVEEWIKKVPGLAH